MKAFSFLIALVVFTSPAFAQVIESVANVDLAQGVCADPAMTDEQRSEMVSRSLEDAVRCMGEEWVFADDDLVQPAAVGGLTISANIALNKVTLVDRDGVPHRFLTSPGTRGNETLVWETKGPLRVEGADYVVQDKDKDYVGAPMPWAVFYKDGYAFHGTYEVKKLGRPASHGCLRLTIANAKFLNEQVRIANDASVKVRVFNQAPPPKPKIRRPRPDQFDEPLVRPAPYGYEYPSYDPRPYYNPWY